MKHHRIPLTLALVFALGGLAAPVSAVDPAPPPPAPGTGPGPAPGMGPGMGPGQGMGPGMGRGMGRDLPTFSDFDTNGDGTLTEDEFNQARAKRMADRAAQGYPMRNAGQAPGFKTLDGDGDGKVTSEEFDAGMADHHQQMMPPR